MTLIERYLARRRREQPPADHRVSSVMDASQNGSGQVCNRQSAIRNRQSAIVRHWCALAKKRAWLRYNGGITLSYWEAHMKGATPAVAVVGSFNMDLVFTTDRRPQRGETIIGRSFSMFLGGKGQNQALAAARLGARVPMIGRLGRDDFGRRIREAIVSEGIDAQHVGEDDEASTGTAAIIIDAEGDNSILIVSGANFQITAEHIDHARDAIAGADVLMMQLEIAPVAIQRAAEVAHAAGVPLVLNPAPARPLADELLRLVGVLTPNEIETEMLTGISVADDESAARAARALLARGVGAVVLTLGARGALLATAAGIERVPGFAVQVVDTTAAGDAFCAGLAVRMASGDSLADAVRYANAVGALATTVLGAAPAMPTRAAVERFIASAG